MQEHAFHLHKGDFQDALSLRYSLLPLHTAKTCCCRTSFSVDHAMMCPFWGFTTFRHNEVYDLTATLLTEVCHNVVTEPPLQPITAENFPYATANTADDARLDIKARGFWCRRQDAFFDVHVFYPNASSYCTLNLSSAYKHHETLRNVNMVIELEKLSMVSLPHWCLLAVWVGRQLLFTNVWQTYLLLAGDNLTVPQFIG